MSQLSPQHRGSTLPAGSQGQPGLAMIELLVAIVAVALLISILLPPLAHQRAMAASGESQNNLRQIGAIHASYQGDNADSVATFSWQMGQTASTYADLKTATSDNEAAGLQAVDIIRRRSNPAFERQTNWYAFSNFSQLVLVDYLAGSAPSGIFTSPSDETLLKWQKDPADWQASGAPNSRSPYRSSYEMLGAAFFDKAAVASNRVTQAQNHSTFMIPGGHDFGLKKVSEVAYPSQKAMAWDLYQREMGRVAYVLYHEARVPVLFVDGAVAVRSTRDSSIGWNPASPSLTLGMTFQYQPLAWEPPALYSSGNFVYGGVRWTRDMLQGRDYDLAVTGRQ